MLWLGPDEWLVIDQTGEIEDFELVYLNPAGAAYLGRARDEVVGRRLRRLWPETLNDSTMPLYRKVVEAAAPENRAEALAKALSADGYAATARSAPVGEQLDEPPDDAVVGPGPNKLVERAVEVSARSADMVGHNRNERLGRVDEVRVVGVERARPGAPPPPPAHREI